MVDVRCHVLCIVVLMRYCPGRSPRVQCSAFSRYAIGWIWGIKQLRIASIVFASWREFLRYHMDLRELLFRDGGGCIGHQALCAGGLWKRNNIAD
ncbi:hypothetical protein SAMN05660380_02034 [Xylella fastidiosa]|nr:hypothetical protein SAMN05660380_02034 [Xylella fastidiosa]